MTCCGASAPPRHTQAMPARASGNFTSTAQRSTTVCKGSPISWRVTCATSSSGWNRTSSPDGRTRFELMLDLCVIDVHSSLDSSSAKEHAISSVAS